MKSGIYLSKSILPCSLRARALYSVTLTPTWAHRTQRQERSGKVSLEHCDHPVGFGEFIAGFPRSQPVAYQADRAKFEFFVIQVPDQLCGVFIVRTKHADFRFDSGHARSGDHVNNVIEAL